MMLIRVRQASHLMSNISDYVDPAAACNQDQHSQNDTPGAKIVKMLHSSPVLNVPCEYPLAHFQTTSSTVVSACRRIRDRCPHSCFCHNIPSQLVFLTSSSMTHLRKPSTKFGFQACNFGVQ